MNTSTESRNRFQEAMAIFTKDSSLSLGNDVRDATRKSYNFKKPDVIAWPSVNVHTTYEEDNHVISELNQYASQNMKITLTNMSKITDSFRSSRHMISETSNNSFGTMWSVSNDDYCVSTETPIVPISIPATEKSCSKPSWAVIRTKMKSIPRPDDFLTGCCPEYNSRHQMALTKQIDLYK